MSGDLLETASRLMEMAGRAGAHAAEVSARRAREHEVTVRRDAIERVEAGDQQGIGLRVFIGPRQGLAYATLFEDDVLGRLITDAIDAARVAAAEPEGALPEPDLTDPPAAGDLDLFDPAVEALSTEDRLRMARAAEAAALSHPMVTGSEGSSFTDAVVETVLVNSHGLHHRHRASRLSLASKPIAGRAEGSGVGRQVQLWYTSARHLADLEDPDTVGRIAAQRAARMVGARPLPTCRAAVVFDPIEAARFWSGLAPAFSGDAARRGVSFLTGMLGRRVASAEVTLVDDGRLPRGIGSAPRDGEGVPTRRKIVIDRGILRTFLYDCRTARKARTVTTANAARGYSSLPAIGALNFMLGAGEEAPEEILASTRRGLYVTHAIGFGVNTTTGDYSRGASGLWIENGEISFPVQEVVISGNLREMLAGVSVVGSDLVLRSAFASPTFRIDEMTISGGPDKTDRRNTP